MRVAIITSSDTGAQGLREDKSGPLIREIVSGFGAEVVSYTLLPDEREMLSAKMREICDNNEAEVILTTGGTGFSKRDCMPEATLDVVERQVPGIPEAMRAYSMQFTPRAMLSRAMAGIRKSTLIVNMPGSPKAIGETLEYIFPQIEHGVDILTGDATDCARKNKAFVFGVCGVKNSGKTTYMEKLVKALKSRDLTVATVKHDGHDFDGDTKGTDSRKMYDAGADATAVFSGSQVLVHEKKVESMNSLLERFKDFDIVLVEGMKEEPIAKVEIVRDGNSNKAVSNQMGRIGIVTDIDGFKSDRADDMILDLDDVEAVVEKILELKSKA